MLLYYTPRCLGGTRVRCASGACHALVPIRHSLSLAAQEAALPPSSTPLGAPLRKDFPILDQSVNGRPLVYLDNAATSQKPTYVLQARRRLYSG